MSINARFHNRRWRRENGEPIAITLLTVTDGLCRWPKGEPSPDMPMCGAPTADGASYCEAHARRAYRPAGEVRT